MIVVDSINLAAIIYLRYSLRKCSHHQRITISLLVWHDILNLKFLSFSTDIVLKLENWLTNQSRTSWKESLTSSPVSSFGIRALKITILFHLPLSTRKEKQSQLWLQIETFGNNDLSNKELVPKQWLNATLSYVSNLLHCRYFSCYLADIVSCCFLKQDLKSSSLMQASVISSS